MSQLTLPSLRKPLADFLTLRELPCGKSLVVLESRVERFKPEPDPLTADGGAVLDCGKRQQHDGESRVSPDYACISHCSARL